MGLFRKKTVDLPPRRRAEATSTKREPSSELDQHAVFRRNRTLTGSLSSDVASVATPGDDLQSSRTQVHHLNRQRRKVGGALVGVLALGLVLAGLIYELTARPVVVAADGAVALQKERYEKVVNEYLDRHPIERLRFVLDRQRLNDYVQHQLSEVIAMRPGGFAGLGASEFRVSLRQPIVSWLIGTNQYYVDSNGVPFQTNYYDIPSVRIVDQSGVQQSPGVAIASSRFLAFVGRAVSSARDSGMTVEQAIIPQGTTRQIELRITGHDYPIKLSLDRGVGEQIEDMQSAVTYLDSKGIKPQYIDVRVSGRAYYK